MTAVWPAPNYSAVFRIKAGYLIAARAEDRLPLPRSEDDPLAAELAQMVHADLRADGLPAGVIRGGPPKRRPVRRRDGRRPSDESASNVPERGPHPSANRGKASWNFRR